MVGDCKNIPCASSVNFESLLMSLFAKTADGCIGIKVVSKQCGCGEGVRPPGTDCADANPCTTDLTLEQLIVRSLVDDGCGGNALSMALLTQLPVCPELCGVHMDLTTLLKRLFTQVGDCFSILCTVSPLTCADGATFQACTTKITAEQVIRASVFQNDCGGLVLPLLMQSVDCGNRMGCDLNLSLDQIVAGLFIKFDDYCGGAIQINPSYANCNTLTDLKDCGTFYTFEQMLRASLVATDCGAAINVFLVNNNQ